MKKMRKLLPAIAMLLLSAVLMSTASFAWFSTNTTATANGMKVTVSSANNLLISDAADGAYKSSHGFGLDIQSLQPASAAAENTPSFFVIDQAGDQMTAENHQYANSSFKAGTANTDYVYKTAYIKAIGDDLVGHYVTPEITISNITNSPVFGAFRVLLVVTDLDAADPIETKNYIYAPDADADTAAKPITSADPITEGTAPTFSTSGTTKILDAVKKENVYQVDIYVWLEGQDSNCKASNAIDITANDISIAFKLLKD